MEKHLVIKGAHGLHARPAGVFAKKAAEFKSDIQVKAAKGVANGKSIMALMSLGLNQGSEITLTANGADAEQAMNALTALLEA
jgi:phosphocarrier protein HPr